MDVVYEAVRRGMINEEDAPRILPEQARALGVIIEMMDSGDADEYPVSEFEMEMYSHELEELGDMLDLHECDRVEPGKKFIHDEVEVTIPDSIVPLMRVVVLPAIREILESAIDKR